MDINKNTDNGADSNRNIRPFSEQWTSPLLPVVEQWMAERPHCALVKGLAGSADSLLISDLFVASNRPVLAIVESAKKAETLCDECRTFLGEGGGGVFSVARCGAVQHEIPLRPDYRGPSSRAGAASRRETDRHYSARLGAHPEDPAAESPFQQNYPPPARRRGNDRHPCEVAYRDRVPP
jgi:hypothetical protein